MKTGTKDVESTGNLALVLMLVVMVLAFVHHHRRAFKIAFALIVSVSFIGGISCLFAK